MTNYTPVKIRQDLYDKIKVKAAADGRSIMNYVERLIIKDVEEDEDGNQSPDV